MENIALFVIMSLIGVLYLVLWAMTLYKQAGEEEAVWFGLTLLFSPLWILYRLVNTK